MLNYGWDIKPFEENKLLHILDVFTKSLEGQYESYQDMSDSNCDSEKYTLSYNRLLYEIYNVEDVINEGEQFLNHQTSGNRIKFIIFDTVTPLFTSNTKGALQIIRSLTNTVKVCEGSLVLLLHRKVQNEDVEQILLSLTNGIIETRLYGENSVFINIVEYPGEHGTGPFPLEFNKQGVNIIPINMPYLV
jgi:hypothetical protein